MSRGDTSFLGGVKARVKLTLVFGVNLTEPNDVNFATVESTGATPGLTPFQVNLTESS